MSCWREWHFPQEFDGFPQLRILKIKNCPELSGDLPAHLPALEELTIINCQELACSLPRAPKLCQLYVTGGNYVYRYDDDEDDDGDDVKPHSVVISGIQLATSVLECLSHIQGPGVQRMHISLCQSAISISSDYMPASLQYLEIFRCSKLTISEQLQHKSLTDIRVEGCGSVTFPLGDLPNLKNLQLSCCKNMAYVDMPHALPSLRYLSISYCRSLASLPALGKAAPLLEKLKIQYCPEIVCFAEDCLPSSLKNLDIFGCDKLASWIASKGLQSEGLTHLVLSRCNDVKSFPREGCLLPASLESLQLWNLPNLETLDCKGLHHLTSLKYLQIRNCYKLENIIQEHLLASIQNIDLGKECPLWTKLEEMEDPGFNSFSGKIEESTSIHR